MSWQDELECGYLERARKRKGEEDKRYEAGNSRGVTTIFNRWGCYNCLGDDEKCARYYTGIKVKRKKNG